MFLSSHSPAQLRTAVRPPVLARALTPFQDKAIDHALAVLRNVSRTFKGESNVESSEDKQPLLVVGKELVDIASRNFKIAVTLLLAVDDASLKDSSSVAQLFGVVGVKLNADLFQRGRGFWRTWELPFKGVVPLRSMKTAFREEFCQGYLTRLHDSTQDPVEFAVWSERTINARLHPLSDGCGKISKAFSTAILARAGLLYPQFESREEYFDMLLKPTLEESVSLYRGRMAKEL